jgi:hypothetical protein
VTFTAVTFTALIITLITFAGLSTAARDLGGPMMGRQ